MLSIRRSQADLEKRFIVLRRDETKSREARAMPILKGDMRGFLQENRANYEDESADAPLFSNCGQPSKIPRSMGKRLQCCWRAGLALS